MIAKTGPRMTWTSLQRMLEMTEMGLLETLNTAHARRAAEA